MRARNCGASKARSSATPPGTTRRAELPAAAAAPHKHTHCLARKAVETRSKRSVILRYDTVKCRAVPAAGSAAAAGACRASRSRWRCCCCKNQTRRSRRRTFSLQLQTGCMLPTDWAASTRPLWFWIQQLWGRSTACSCKPLREKNTCRASRSASARTLAVVSAAATQGAAPSQRRAAGGKRARETAPYLQPARLRSPPATCLRERDPGCCQRSGVGHATESRAVKWHRRRFARSARCEPAERSKR